LCPDGGTEIIREREGRRSSFLFVAAEEKPEEI
jgi:hypothetical protein